MLLFCVRQFDTHILLRVFGEFLVARIQPVQFVDKVVDLLIILLHFNAG